MQAPLSSSEILADNGWYSVAQFELRERGLAACYALTLPVGVFNLLEPSSNESRAARSAN